MIGIRRNGISIGVSSLPNRKKPCLYVQKENVVFQVGQLKSSNDAALFFAALEYAAFGQNEDKVRSLLQEMEIKVQLATNLQPEGG